MVDSHDGPPPEARPPQLADLLSLCRSLNRESVRYVVVGGMAMIQAGFVRATEDIDLLVDADRDNLHRLRTALLDLPDQAVREMGEDDLDHYVVVRIADEFVVDLLKVACGIEFEEARGLGRGDRDRRESESRSRARNCFGEPSRRSEARTSSTACSSRS